MKVLAVIPARGGSKGLPGKNMCKVGGRTLVDWAILAASPRPCVEQNGKGLLTVSHTVRAVVSSDEPAILAHARLIGAEALERPAALATDDASTDAVLAHALDHVVKASGWRPDVVALLQPTSPVRPPFLLDDALDRLVSTGADSLFTATALHHVWGRARALSGPAHALRDGPWECLTPRVPRQSAYGPQYVHEDGALFLARTELLEKTGARLGGHVEAFVIPYSPDIDTEGDLRLAQTLIRSRLCGEDVSAPFVMSTGERYDYAETQPGLFERIYTEPT